MNENFENQKYPEIFKVSTELEVAGIKIPTTFEIKEDNSFCLYSDQYEEELNTNGMISNGVARINHIHIPNELRGKGIGKMLLSELEKQLQNYGVHTSISTFSKTETIDFFLSQDYKIVPTDTISEEERGALYMDREPIDDWIQGEDDYNILKSRNKKGYEKKLCYQKILKMELHNNFIIMYNLTYKHLIVNLKLWT